MKKVALATLAVCVMASMVSAQSVIWMDVRNNTTGFNSITTPTYPFTNGQGTDRTETAAFNGGRAGDGQVLRLNPVMVGGFHTQIQTNWPNLDGDKNLSTGSLFVYMDVNDEPSGTGDVISSVGIDFNVAANTATPKNPIGSLSWAWDATLWSGTNAGINNGASNGATPPSWLGAKAVKVPVSATATYDTTGGLVPTNTYKLGELKVVAGARNCTFAANHHLDSTYKVNMSVNDLLITRVFQAGGDPTEMVSFGYVGANPETPVSGSTVGAGANGTPDAYIEILMKCDRSLDGRVLNNDLAGFFEARTAATSATQYQVYLFDFSGDGRVLNNDLAGFFTARTASATCP